MRRIIALAASASLLVTGCTPIAQELRNSGGYPGYLLDRHMFDASRSKEIHLLRAAIILSMAARMATATVRDGAEADAFAAYLAASSDELNHAAADLYSWGPNEADGPCPLRADAQALQPCRSYYALFESDMPILEARIIRLMLAALPESRGRQFLASATKGDVLAASFAAIRGAYETASGLHRSAAVYRTGLEILASSACKAAFNPKTDNIWAAVDCLGLSHDSIKHVPGELSGEQMRFEVSRDAFHALMLIARTSCAKLPLSSEPNIDDELSKREDACKRVTFDPKPRDETVGINTADRRAAPATRPARPTSPATPAAADDHDAR